MPATATSEVTAKLVGAELRRARLELGASQAEIARKLEVSKPYLANVEAGRENLTLGQLARIARALDCQLKVELAARPAPAPAARRAVAAGHAWTTETDHTRYPSRGASDRLSGRRWPARRP